MLDADCRIVGYELQIRPLAPLPVLPGATSLAQIQDEALLTTVIDLDYQQALDDKLTLLSLDAATLGNPLVQMLKPDRTLLIMPTGCSGEAVEATATLAARASAWSGTSCRKPGKDSSMATCASTRASTTP